MRPLIVEKLTWPYGKMGALAITVDDIHPESSEDPDHLDFGGNMDRGNFAYLDAIMRVHPDVRVTLFLVPAWEDRTSIPLWRYSVHLEPVIQNTVLRSRRLLALARKTKTRKKYQEGRYRIDRDYFRNWCDWLRRKVKASNFEVAIHGLTHFGLGGFSSSQEFSGLGLQECIQKLQSAEEIVTDSGIPFVRGFRPPAWGIDSVLLKALELRGYHFVAGSADYVTPISPEATAQQYGLRGISLLQPELRDGLVVMASNVESLEDDRVLRILEMGGLAIIDVHFAKTGFGLSHLSPKFSSSASRLLSHVKDRFPNGVWFAKLDEIAAFYRARENCALNWTQAREGDYLVSVLNRSEFQLDGLTLRFEPVPSSLKVKRGVSALRVHGAGIVSLDVPSGGTAEIICQT